MASSEIVEPSISSRTPVSTGSMSSRPAAVTAWATALANSVAAHRAGGLRHLRQRRVVLDRHRLQAEPGGAAGQRDLGAVDGHLDRLVGQAAADVGEQPAGDQGPALVGDVGGERGPGRGLVVERGQLQAVAALDRSRSAGRRAPGRWDGPGGCGPPRRRHRRGRRARRGTSRVLPPAGRLRAPAARRASPVSGVSILPRTGRSRQRESRSCRHRPAGAPRGVVPRSRSRGDVGDRSDQYEGSVVVAGAVDTVDNSSSPQVRPGLAVPTACGRRRGQPARPVGGGSASHGGRRELSTGCAQANDTIRTGRPQLCSEAVTGAAVAVTTGGPAA